MLDKKFEITIVAKTPNSYVNYNSVLYNEKPSEDAIHKEIGVLKEKGYDVQYAYINEYYYPKGED